LLGIGRVVIHRARHAVSACGAGGFFQEAPFCEAPRKSTGAGDRFNAGFCLGLALGFGDGDCLVLGCGVAGWFVRKGASPSFEELKGFLGEWRDGLIL
jgi:sugar/nucleoside kinase (ribokinase family)